MVHGIATRTFGKREQRVIEMLKRDVLGKCSRKARCIG